MDIFSQELIWKAKMWALLNGISMRGPVDFSVKYAPFTLYPSPFPADQFQKALRLQSGISQLIHSVSMDSEFLLGILKSTIEVDSFTKRLYQIFQTVLKEGIAQPTSLGILRTDYMLHQPTKKDIGQIKMVEINTIASSFAGISSRFADFRRFILGSAGKHDQIPQIPDNSPVKGIAEGLVAAWSIYGVKSAIILMVVEDVPANVGDQMLHEIAVKEVDPEVIVWRRSITKLAGLIRIDDGKKLFLCDTEVAVVYYRAGYEPEHYPTEAEWDSRLLIERSCAVKCPSINYHLAGTKKVQQELARPGVLERYIKDPALRDGIRSTFVGLYSLDLNEEGDAAATLGILHPEKYVLKPQREGGGNNVYGQEVARLLDKLCCTPERAAYVLMELIIAPAHENCIIRAEEHDPIIGPVVSELGVYGIVIGDDKQVLLNTTTGHLLRSKLQGTNEGGIVAGFGALDSPLLVDE